MSRFMRILLAITAGCHVPFAVAAFEGLRRLGAPFAAALAGGVVLAVLLVATFALRARHMMNDERRPWPVTFLVDAPYYIHWSACVFTVIPSAVYVLLGPLVSAARGLPLAPSPGFFLWTYLLGLVVCGYGVTLRRWFFQVQHVDVPVKGLPKALDGYRVGHLSDLHIGANTPLWWGRRWARAANAEGCDAVCVTGDMVTSGVVFHEDIATLVGELRAKDGVFVSMGNHDYFGQGEPLVSLIRAKGVRVLRNEGVMVERGGGRLFLTAIDDTWTKRADMKRALASREAGVPTLLLAHDPDTFPEAASHGVELVLSGHTHGGQIAVPFLARRINASKLAHRFHLGLYRQGDSTLYVHPGLGTTGPPIRLGVAPAVVILTLRAA